MTHVGTIAHGGHLSRSRAMTALMVAALLGEQSNPVAAKIIDEDMKRLFKTNLKVPKRKYAMREQVRAFTALPKIDINAIDVLQFTNSLKGVKSSVTATMFDIMEVYRNESTVEEINDLKGWSNQMVAQFIHGAYAIIDNDLTALSDHYKEDPRQKNNLNTLRSVQEEIYRRMNAGLIAVISAPEPNGNQVMSPEAVTAVKDFEGVYRRINNVTKKISSLGKLQKG